jgi:hypothetical protein
MGGASILKRQSQSRAVEDPHFLVKSKDSEGSVGQIKCKLISKFKKNGPGAEMAIWSNL